MSTDSNLLDKMMKDAEKALVKNVIGQACEVSRSTLCTKIKTI